MVKTIKKVTAARLRKCRQCGKEINKGTNCFLTTGSGQYSHTICLMCVTDLLREAWGEHGYHLTFD